MFIFFLIAAALVFGFVVSLSLWLGSGRGTGVSPDGTPYSEDVIKSAAKSTKSLGRTLSAITGAGLILCAGWYFFYHQSDAQVAARIAAEVNQACNNSTMAYVMSQNFVKRGLKSPNSAKFPSLGQAKSEPVGGCRFLVEAFVDSQNSFGAMLRTSYSTEMEYLPDTKMWRAHNLRME